MTARATRVSLWHQTPLWCGLWLLVLILTCVGLARQWQQGLVFSSDILSLVPHAGNPLNAKLARRQSEAFAQRLMVVLSGAQPAQVTAARAGILRDFAALARDATPARELPSRYKNPLAEAPYSLATPADRELLLARNSAGLVANAWQYWLGFASVANLGLNPAEDPFALVARALRDMGGAAGSANGVFEPVASQQAGHTLWRQVVLLDLLNPAQGLKAQQAAAAQVEQKLTQLRREFPGVTMGATGLVLHSAASASTSQREIAWITACSTLFIIGLCWLVYRHLLPLVAAFGTIAFGSLVGLVGCLSWFGQVHVLAVAFGTSLMGVVVDYSFHYFSVQRQLPTASSARQAVLARVMPSISLSLITAVGGYLGLLQTGMEVLQQIAVLCILGILAAWLTIVALYPLLPSLALPAGRLRVDLLLAPVARGWSALTGRQLVWLALGLMISVSLLAHHFSLATDARVLYQPPAQLQALDRQIAELQPDFAANQYLVVSGANPQELVRRQNALRPQLQQLRDSGQLTGYTMLAQWLPEEQANLQLGKAYNELLDSAAARDFFTQLGVSAPAASAVPDSAQWLAALPDDVRSALLIQLDQHTWVGVVRLGGIHNSDALAAQVAAWQLPYAWYMDSVTQVSRGLRQQTQKALEGLALAYVLAAAVLFARYRGWLALALIGVPLISSVLTLTLITLLGEVSLFHLLALFLALGLGVDYAIIFAHSRDFPAGVSGEIVSLAALGNALSFGLLGFSSLPLLAAFGCAVGLCLASNFVMAPLVMRWVKPR